MKTIFKWCKSCKSQQSIKRFENDDSTKDGLKDSCTAHDYRYNSALEDYITIEDIEGYDIETIVEDIFNLSRDDNDPKKTNDVYKVPFCFREMIVDQRKLMSELRSI